MQLVTDAAMSLCSGDDILWAGSKRRNLGDMTFASDCAPTFHC